VGVFIPIIPGGFHYAVNLSAQGCYAKGMCEGMGAVEVNSDNSIDADLYGLAILLMPDSAVGDCIKFFGAYHSRKYDQGDAAARMDCAADIE